MWELKELNGFTNVKKRPLHPILAGRFDCVGTLHRRVLCGVPQWLRKWFLRVTNNVVYTEFYPVGDLVTPFGNGHGPRGADYDTLIELLQSTVLPNEWDDIRKITLLEDVRVAAISHSREGHDSIRELLEQVRLPLQRFEDLVDQGKCPYCAKAPLPPELGDRCTNCNVARHQPTIQHPAPR